MDDVTIRGLRQLTELSAKLKETGNRGLRNELLRGIRAAATPMVAAARESARENLPHRGGLADLVASSKFGVRTRTAGRSPAVRVIGVNRGHDIEDLDRGVLRHPVFGSKKWVGQQLNPGWFTDAMLGEVPQIRAEVVKAIERVKAKL